MGNTSEKKREALENMRPDNVDQGIWTALLQWSLKHHDKNTNNPNNIQAMSNDDQKFLLNVFDSMVMDENKLLENIKHILSINDDVSNLIKEQDKIIKYLQLQGNISKDGLNKFQSLLDQSSYKEIQNNLIQLKLDKLDQLDDICLTIDNSNNFTKMNGLKILFYQCLTHTNLDIKLKSAQVIGTIVQNNPKCQAIAFELNGIAQLWSLIDQNYNINLQVKGFFALASLLREYKPALLHFIKVKGIEQLLVILSAHETIAIRVQRKNLKLLHYIWSNIINSQQIANQYIYMFIDLLTSSNDIDIIECIIDILYLLIQSPNASVIINTLKKDFKRQLHPFIDQQLHEINQLTDQDDIEYSQDKKIKLTTLLQQTT